MNQDIFNKLYRAMQAQRQGENEYLSERIRMFEEGASTEELEEHSRLGHTQVLQRVQDAVKNGTEAAPPLPSVLPPNAVSLLEGLLSALTGEDATPMLSAHPSPKRATSRKRAVKPKPVRTASRSDEAQDFREDD